MVIIEPQKLENTKPGQAMINKIMNRKDIDEKSIL